jgi:hypothetical protein
LFTVPYCQSPGVTASMVIARGFTLTLIYLKPNQGPLLVTLPVMTISLPVNRGPASCSKTVLVVSADGMKSSSVFARVAASLLAIKLLLVH